MWLKENERDDSFLTEGREEGALLGDTEVIGTVERIVDATVAVDIAAGAADEAAGTLGNVFTTELLIIDANIIEAVD